MPTPGSRPRRRNIPLAPPIIHQLLQTIAQRRPTTARRHQTIVLHPHSTARQAPSSVAELQQNSTVRLLRLLLPALAQHPPSTVRQVLLGTTPQRLQIYTSLLPPRFRRRIQPLRQSGLRLLQTIPRVLHGVVDLRAPRVALSNCPLTAIIWNAHRQASLRSISVILMLYLNAAIARDDFSLCISQAGPVGYSLFQHVFMASSGLISSSCLLL